MVWIFTALLNQNWINLYNSKRAADNYRAYHRDSRSNSEGLYVYVRRALLSRHRHDSKNEILKEYSLKCQTKTVNGYLMHPT